MAAKQTPAEPSKPRRPPALSPEARENQLIALAVDLAEEQLSNGTASSQVITHYLKLGTTRERLEQQKLAHENELLKARTQQIADGQKLQDLYAGAIAAMRVYAGQDVPDEEEDYDAY
jgi:hypothetical protein